MTGDPVLFHDFYFSIDWNGTGLLALGVALFVFLVWLGRRPSRTKDHPPKP